MPPCPPLSTSLSQLSFKETVGLIYANSHKANVDRHFFGQPRYTSRYILLVIIFFFRCNIFLDTSPLHLHCLYQLTKKCPAQNDFGFAQNKKRKAFMNGYINFVHLIL